MGRVGWEELLFQCFKSLGDALVSVCFITPASSLPRCPKHKNKAETCLHQIIPFLINNLKKNHKYKCLKSTPLVTAQ